MQGLVRKLIRDYIYYSDTLEDVKSISSDAEKNFREALMETDPAALEALAMPEGSEKPKAPEEKEDITFDDKDFKKLFRKLAVKCHPDKTQDASEREAEFLKQCYDRITLANDTYDWGLLLRVAYDLEVEVQELSEEQQLNIQQNIEDIQNSISAYEGSMAYTWYTLNDTSIKEKYLQECADIFKMSLKNRLS
jgi:hypothetical protein